MNKKEKRIQSKRDTRIGCVILLISFLAIIPFAYSGAQYSVTIIPLKYIIICSLLAGLFIIILIYKAIQRIQNKDLYQLKEYLMGTMICGCYVSSLFFATNIYLSKSEMYSIETPLIDKYESWKRHNVFIVVNINGIEKNISIPNKKISEMDKYNSVVLTFDKGYWNFPFIVDIVLKE